MAKKNNIIAFLDIEPPRSPRLLRQLFVSREDLLATTVDRLKAIRREDPKRILAITGLARVGKSHLLRRALLEVKRSFQVVIEMKITPGHSGGAAVLREMLNQTTAELHNVALKKGILGDDGKPVLEPLQEILRLYSEAIAGHAAEIQIQEASTLATGLKRRLGGSFKMPRLATLFSGLELGVDAQRESNRQQSQTTSRQIRVNVLREDALCELISLGHELLRQVQPGWQTLLVVDDFDILHRSRAGSLDPVPLMQQLFNLAQTEGLHVVTTVREDTFRNHDKVFYRMVKVRAFAQDETLIDAYRRRVSVHHSASNPCLSEDLVQEVARRTEGRVGVFFQWLKELYDEGVASDLRGWFEQQWSTASSIERTAAKHIRDAAFSGNLLSNEAAQIRKTELMRFTLEDYSSFDNMRVDPVARALLLEILEAQGE